MLDFIVADSTSTNTIIAELCHTSVYRILHLPVLAWMRGEWRHKKECLRCEWSGAEYDSCVENNMQTSHFI